MMPMLGVWLNENDALAALTLEADKSLKVDCMLHIASHYYRRQDKCHYRRYKATRRVELAVFQLAFQGVQRVYERVAPPAPISINCSSVSEAQAKRHKKWPKISTRRLNRDTFQLERQQHIPLSNDPVVTSVSTLASR